MRATFTKQLKKLSFILKQEQKLSVFKNSRGTHTSVWWATGCSSLAYILIMEIANMQDYANYDTAPNRGAGYARSNRQVETESLKISKWTVREDQCLPTNVPREIEE
jgi:hypothetical protein